MGNEVPIWGVIPVLLIAAIPHMMAAFIGYLIAKRMFRPSLRDSVRDDRRARTIALRRAGWSDAEIATLLRAKEETR